jgi:hypothetical protein
MVNIYWLVVSTILKNMKVNGKDDNTYMKWKIKFMFETTSQKRLGFKPGNVSFNMVQWIVF